MTDQIGARSLPAGSEPTLFAALVLGLTLWLAGVAVYRWLTGVHDVETYAATAFGDASRRLVVRGLTYSAFVVGAAWYTEVPLAAIGLGLPGRVDLLAGVGVGVGLVATTTILSDVLAAVGLPEPPHAEAAERSLLPDREGEWPLALLIVYPISTVGGEFLFRGALVSGLDVAWGVPVGLLVGLSAILFGLINLWQGNRHAVSSGVVGGGLAAALALTGSLWTPVVALYVLNVTVAVGKTRGHLT